MSDISTYMVVSYAPDDVFPLILATSYAPRSSFIFRIPRSYWDSSDYFGILEEKSGGAPVLINTFQVLSAIIPGIPAAGDGAAGDPLYPFMNLSLEAVEYPTAAAAAAEIELIDFTVVDPFCMVIADSTEAFFLSADTLGLKKESLRPGVHIITKEGLNASTSEARQALSLFQRLERPKPQFNAWDSWILTMKYLQTPLPAPPRKEKTAAEEKTDTFLSVLALSANMGGEPLEAPRWIFSKGIGESSFRASLGAQDSDLSGASQIHQ